jgi:RNA polymerase sigma factor (sigma-70 family)
MPKPHASRRTSSTRGPTEILTSVFSWVFEWARTRVDSDTAQDLANDMAISVWERIQLEPTFLSGPGDFDRFISVASRHALINYLRSNRRRLRREAAFETAYQEREPIWMRPEEQADYAELTDAHEASVARVSARLREAYRLVAEEELSIAAAASLLNVAPRAVETRLRRVRKQLRKDLAEFRENVDDAPRVRRGRAA